MKTNPLFSGILVSLFLFYSALFKRRAQNFRKPGLAGNSTVIQELPEEYNLQTGRLFVKLIIRGKRTQQTDQLIGPNTITR